VTRKQLASSFGLLFCALAYLPFGCCCCCW